MVRASYSQQVHILEPAHNRSKPTKIGYRLGYKWFGPVPSLNDPILGCPDPFNISIDKREKQPCKTYYNFRSCLSSSHVKISCKTNCPRMVTLQLSWYLPLLLATVTENND